MKFSQIFLLVISLCAITTNLSAQPHTVELIAPDAKGDDAFGTSVAIRGKFAVVGAPGHNRVYVFENLSGTWSQVAELTPSNAGAMALFGYAVAISDAGDTIAVGAPYLHNVIGGAYVFVEPPTGWTDMTETAQLGTPATTPREFGFSVAISGDGTQVISGTFNFGAAAYTRPATGWVTTSTPTAKLAIPSSSQGFGSSMAIAAGNLVVGAYAGSDGTGAAYVFKLSHLNGQERIVKPYATLSSSDGSESWISVAAKGNTIVAGAPFNILGTGAVYVFVEPSSGWTDMTQTAEITLGGPASGTFGESLAVSDELVLVGATLQKVLGVPAGEVFAYRQPATGWTDTSLPDAMTAAPDGGYRDHFGDSISLDGNTMIVGALSHDLGGFGNQGAAYIVSSQ